MSIIHSRMLGLIQKLIGGGSGSLVTVLDDDSVTQVLPVIPEIARRSLTIGNIGGWFLAVLENVHTSDDFEQSSIPVYTPAAAAVIPPYPLVVPDDQDIWLIGASLIRTTGAGSLAAGVLAINPPSISQGLGIDDAGATVIGTPMMSLAHFNGLNTVLGSVNAFGITAGGDPYVPIGLRLPRFTTLVFNSESGGAATCEFQMIAIMALFPAGLGQDVVA